MRSIRSLFLVSALILLGTPQILFAQDLPICKGTWTNTKQTYSDTLEMTSTDEKVQIKADVDNFRYRLEPIKTGPDAGKNTIVFCVHTKVTVDNKVVFDKQLQLNYMHTTQIDFGTYSPSEALTLNNFALDMTLVNDASGHDEFALRTSLGFIDVNPGKRSTKITYFSR